MKVLSLQKYKIFLSAIDVSLVKRMVGATVLEQLPLSWLGWQLIFQENENLFFYNEKEIGESGKEERHIWGYVNTR